jgi:hypothetical protein
MVEAVATALILAEAELVLDSCGLRVAPSTKPLGAVSKLSKGTLIRIDTSKQDTQCIRSAILTG